MLHTFAEQNHGIGDYSDEVRYEMGEVYYRELAIQAWQMILSGEQKIIVSESPDEVRSTVAQTRDLLDDLLDEVDNPAYEHRVMGLFCEFQMNAVTYSREVFGEY